MQLQRQQIEMSRLDAHVHSSKACLAEQYIVSSRCGYAEKKSRKKIRGGRMGRWEKLQATVFRGEKSKTVCAANYPCLTPILCSRIPRAQKDHLDSDLSI